MGSDGALGTCAKVILILTNIFFLMFGILILVGGVILKFLPRFVSIEELQAQILTTASSTTASPMGGENVDLGSLINNTAIALICVGVVIVVLAILGMCGACCSAAWMLLTYGMVVLLLLIGQVAAVALLATGTIDNEIKNKLNETIQEDYGGINSFNIPSLLLNAAMLVFDCCGIDDYTDFNGAANWIKQHDYNGQMVTLVIPVACCKRNESFPSVTPKDEACLTQPDDNNSNRKQGCFERFKEVVIDRYKTAIIAGVSVFLVFEFILAVLAIAIAVKSSAKKRDRW